MFQSQRTANTKTKKGALPQIIGGARKKPVSQATAVNQYVRSAVIRLTCDSCLKFKDFGRLAKYAGCNEPTAIAIIAETIRTLRQYQPHDPGPGAPLKRAA